MKDDSSLLAAKPTTLLTEPRRLRPLGNHSFALLLASLVLLLLASPLLEGDAAGNRYLTLLFTLVLLAAIAASSARRWSLWVALSLALPWSYLSWLHPLWQGDGAGVVANLLFVCFGIFVAGLILTRIAKAKAVGIDTLCGAVAAYLLLAIVWAVCYGIIEALLPGSFGFEAADFDMIWNHLLYFSLVTLSTLGYGDITPLSSVARIWSAFEAVVGTLYLTVLIARLVSLYRT